jgi:3'-phosphoadenosine 5'-phosphosulfate sulfotransferase (PAPS reductase)/FAD synthetase
MKIKKTIDGVDFESVTKKYMCIVPVSGGKDSQACLKMAIEEFGSDNVLGFFCDTKFEHPKTYVHVKYMSKLYGVRIIAANSGEVLQQSSKNKRFPGGGARFCTDHLKIRPTRIFLKYYSEMFGGVQVWYGMRTDESSERSKRYEFKDPDELYQPHEVIGNYPKYLGKNGVRYRLPIVDWYVNEVMEYLDGEHNPLYNSYLDDDGIMQPGFTRVGCFPCLAGGDKAKVKAFEYDKFGAQQLINVRVVENEINKSVFTAKIGQAWDDDNQGCRICEI